MKLPAGVMLAAALMFLSAACQARGQPTSSFAPRGPEPHATLSHKNGVKKSSHKTSHKAKPAVVSAAGHQASAH
jgi:hypothetical protein